MRECKKKREIADVMTRLLLCHKSDETQGANMPRCRGGGTSGSGGVVSRADADLPSQLLHELRVVRREELDHEAQDGVLRP